MKWALVGIANGHLMPYAQVKYIYFGQCVLDAPVIANLGVFLYVTILLVLSV